MGRFVQLVLSPHRHLRVVALLKTLRGGLHDSFFHPPTMLAEWAYGRESCPELS